MEFFTVYQTPYVFVKNRTQFFNVHVDNLDRTTPLKMFHRDNTERVVIPVFKSREDATRFQRSAIQTKTCCHTFDTWKTAEVYPIDVNMNHLSLTTKVHTVPKYLWDECELYEPTPLDLNDIDAILSLSLKAHIGYFVVYLTSVWQVCNCQNLQPSRLQRNLPRPSPRPHRPRQFSQYPCRTHPRKSRRAYLSHPVTTTRIQSPHRIS